jgi:hypothetical protein
MDGSESLALPHLFRAMEVLDAHKDAIAHALDGRLADRLSREVERRFYDTTSRHVDIEAIDWGVGEADGVAGRPAAGAKTEQAPRQRGLSKNGRGAAPHIVVGLAVTRDGVPVRHGVLPGTTVDVTTGAQVKAALRGWHLSHGVVVGDAGMVSHEQLPTRSARGGKYLLGMPLRRGDAVTRAVFQRPGRDPRVADKRRVKEVGGGAGERRRRDLVCHPPQEETRPRAPRPALLRELAAELASLHEVRGAGPTKRVCELRASRRYGRYRRLTKGGLLRIDAAQQREEARLDGTFVVHRNDDSLTPADLALGYQQRQRGEEAWRTLNNGRRLRPVFHGAVHRIQAHVALSVLALLVERVIAHACGETWRHIRADVEQINLAPWSSPHGEIWPVPEPSSDAANRLQCLEIKNPPAVLHLACSPTYYLLFRLSCI